MEVNWAEQFAVILVLIPVPFLVIPAVNLIFLPVTQLVRLFRPVGVEEGTSNLINVNPSSGLVISPVVTNESTFILTYSGASAFYPKRLNEVRLFYKKGEGDWTDSGLTGSDSSGEFEFTVDNPSQATTYHFDLQATDNFGTSSSNPSGNGDSTTIYQLEEPIDNEPPVADSIFISISPDGQEILVSYQNARDIGFSGLKTVELWYKKGEEGIWTDSGLSRAESTDLFTFDPSSLSGTYYFALVLEDNAGNRSAEPSGDGQGNVVFEAKPFSALVSGPDVPITSLDFIEIFMGGEDIVAYKYKVNESDYSQEIPVNENLFLTNLQEGNYAVSVIGKNSQGFWQDVSSPSTYSWIVDFSQPTLSISGPNPPQTITQESDSKQVTYTLIYTQSEAVTLDLSDITLFKTGTADAILSLSQLDTFTYLVTLDQIRGLGTLRFSIAPGTASHPNANVAAGVETSRITLVNIDPIPVEQQQEFEEEVESVEPLEQALENDDQAQDEPEQEEVEELDAPEDEFTAPEPKITYASDQLIEKAREALALQGVIESAPVKLQLPEELESCEEESILDEDGDGLASRNECQIGTFPDLSDSDADGCSDGEEVILLMTDPLDGGDCPQDLSSSIITPQAGWVIPELHIKGLTPDQSSFVDFFVFPVANGARLDVDPIKLGRTNRFKFSGQEQGYFFEYTPAVNLVDGQTYDLVAVSTLTQGGLVSSQPIRFTLESSLTIDPPELLSISSVDLGGQSDLSQLEVRAPRKGVLEVRGKSELGQRIIALWEPIMMSSSVLVDSPSGEFVIHAPEPLQVNKNHTLTLYALAQQGEQDIRSDQVQLNFYLQENQSTLLLIVVSVISGSFVLAGVGRFLFLRRG